jgi:hypothetical protein
MYHAEVRGAVGTRLQEYPLSGLEISSQICSHQAWISYVMRRFYQVLPEHQGEEKREEERRRDERKEEKRKREERRRKSRKEETKEWWEERRLRIPVWLRTCISTLQFVLCPKYMKTSLASERMRPRGRKTRIVAIW